MGNYISVVCNSFQQSWKYAITMSKIPQIGSSRKPSGQDENRSVFKKPTDKLVQKGVKRQSDSQQALADKKQKTTIGAPLTKKALTTPSQPKSYDFVKSAGFSERAKRAALQPVSESAMMRGSMPALSMGATLKAKTSKAKRPAWDLKGRIADMEEKLQQHQARNGELVMLRDEYDGRIAALEAANSVLHRDVEIKETQSTEATEQVQRLQEELRAKTNQFDDMTKDKDATIHKLQQDKIALEHQLGSLKVELDNLQNTYRQETASLKSSISTLTCSKSGIQAQLSATESIVENLKLELQESQKTNSQKQELNERQEKRIIELESKLREEETTRRKLHNAVQELKGNIRVFCRIRPALPEELQNGTKFAKILTPTQKSIEIEPIADVGLNEGGSRSQPKGYTFSFDHVFAAGASQDSVFSEISQLVQSSLDGYNVCVFAYGQTGSGKTYTMEGPESLDDFLSEGHEEALGMIPRAVRQVFQCAADLEPMGWTYKIEAFFLEIYNEKIQDLLNSDSQSGNQKCEIKRSGIKGECLLSNVTTSSVSSAEAVFKLLKKARINRAVAATKCNEYSSRSHYVFQLKISGENSVTSEKCDGILNLVDLAGSERIKDSGSAGDRLAEAKAINKSLSNLGNVIMALSKKESHIPYRDSKLTHLLANSLGGNSKSLMFVNISPESDNINETINSLRFATKVNQCNIGTAQKRVK